MYGVPHWRVLQAGMEERMRVWQRLQSDLPPQKLAACTTSTIGLAEVAAVGAATLQVRRARVVWCGVLLRV
jgi:hypothetical protein